MSNNAVPDSDLAIGGGAGGGGGLPQKYFRPFGPQFGLKIWAPPLDPLVINSKH